MTPPVLPDLSVVADVLSRAADKAEQMAKEAAPGPWTVSDGNEGTEYPPLWMVTNDAFHNPPADEDAPWLAVEVRTGSRNEAEHIAAFDPLTVAALVPVLRDAEAAALGASAYGYPPDRPWTGCDVVLGLAAFAALLLGEEETP